MPAPLDYADYDGITSYHLALCDPPTGGPTYCRPLSGVAYQRRNRAVLASLQATCSTRAFRTVPPQELTDAAHKAARLIDTDAHIQTASRSYTRALWYQSRVWDPDD